MTDDAQITINNFSENPVFRRKVTGSLLIKIFRKQKYNHYAALKTCYTKGRQLVTSCDYYGTFVVFKENDTLEENN